jgi:hypothetical protein
MVFTQREACAAVGLQLPPLRRKRVCDKGRVQQQVLLGLSRACCNDMCVMRDIEDRLPAHTKEALDGLMPSRGATSDERVQSFLRLREYLRLHGREAFPSNATAPCLSHKRRCSVLAEPPQPKRRLVGEQPPLTGRSSLIIHTGSNSCVAWTPVGGRSRSSHDSERTHQIILAERRQRALQGHEDIYIPECVPGYDEMHHFNTLLDTHDILVLNTSSSFMGWPVKRARKLIACVARSKLRYTGPEDYQTAFAYFFYQHVQITASDIIADSQQDYHTEMKALARSRRCASPQAIITNEIGVLILLLLLISNVINHILFILLII